MLLAVDKPGEEALCIQFIMRSISRLKNNTYLLAVTAVVVFVLEFIFIIDKHINVLRIKKLIN